MTTPSRTRTLRRRTTAASAALLLGLSLAACGGGDSDDQAGDTPSSRATEEPTTEPTTTTETATEATETASSGVVPSEDELAAALLTAADLPAGFTVSPDDGDDDSDNPFEGTCLADVGKFSDALGSEPDEEAEVELASESATGQVTVDSQVEAYADPATVATTFASFTDDLQSCTAAKATSADGVTYDFDIAYDDTVDLPGADDQLGFDVTGTISSGAQTFPARFNFVVALAGPFVSVVGVFTLGEDTSGVVDTANDLAVLQAERVAELG